MFRSSVAPRLVAIAASGAIHATALASLAFTTLEKRPLANEAVLILETQEQVPAPPAVAPPLEPKPAHDLRPRPRLATPETDRREVVEPPTAAPDFLARFMTTLPPAESVPVATSGEGTNEAVADPRAETTYGEDDVSTPARLLSNVNATYPMQAWSSGIEAEVPVEIVVDAQGSVVSARVVTRVGHGFDDAALASIKSYRFAPAQRDGHAVRVRVRWSIQFRLRR